MKQTPPQTHPVWDCAPPSHLVQASISSGHWGGFLLSLPVWFHSEKGQTARMQLLSPACSPLLPPAHTAAQDTLASLPGRCLHRAFAPAAPPTPTPGTPAPQRAHLQGLGSESSSQAASPPAAVRPDATRPTHLPSSPLPCFLTCTYASSTYGPLTCSVHCQSPPTRVGASWAGSLVCFVLLEHRQACSRCQVNASCGSWSHTSTHHLPASFLLSLPRAMG